MTIFTVEASDELPTSHVKLGIDEDFGFSIERQELMQFSLIYFNGRRPSNSLRWFNARGLQVSFSIREDVGVLSTTDIELLTPPSGKRVAIILQIEEAPESFRVARFIIDLTTFVYRTTVREVVHAQCALHCITGAEGNYDDQYGVDLNPTRSVAAGMVIRHVLQSTGSSSIPPTVADVEMPDTFQLLRDLQDLKPTVPYEVEDPNSVPRIAQPRRASAADIYRQVGSHLSQFEYLSAPPVELHEHVKLSRVWQTCQHGPPIALDEMNFIIRQVAHATDCVNLGAWTVDQVFDREVLSLFEEPMEEIGKVSALLLNQHWRLIYVDCTVNPQELHWFYSYLIQAMWTEPLQMHLKKLCIFIWTILHI